MRAGSLRRWGRASNCCCTKREASYCSAWCSRLVTFSLPKSVDNYQIKVLMTLAAVTGDQALASRLYVSGPLAMVVAGLMIGNQGRSLVMSDTTRR